MISWSHHSTCRNVLGLNSIFITCYSVLLQWLDSVWLTPTVEVAGFFSLVHSYLLGKVHWECQARQRAVDVAGGASLVGAREDKSHPVCPRIFIGLIRCVETFHWKGQREKSHFGLRKVAKKLEWEKRNRVIVYKINMIKLPWSHNFPLLVMIKVMVLIWVLSMELVRHRSWGQSWGWSLGPS